MIQPEDLLETVSRVVTPSVVLPATESTSILKEIQKDISKGHLKRHF